MRNFSTILYLLTTLVSWNCSTNKDQFAPEIKYYFEVTCGTATEDCQLLKEYLENEIPLKKYTITNQSGKIWPYYEAYEKDVRVPIDSLMPPHWQIHQFIKKTKTSKLKEGEFLVEFDLYPLSDTLTNYKVTIYKMEDANLSLSATTGIKIEDITHKDTTLTYQEAFLKAIIRYSFK